MSDCFPLDAEAVELGFAVLAEAAGLVGFDLGTEPLAEREPVFGLIGDGDGEVAVLAVIALGMPVAVGPELFVGIAEIDTNGAEQSLVLIIEGALAVLPALVGQPAAEAQTARVHIRLGRGLAVMRADIALKTCIIPGPGVFLLLLQGPVKVQGIQFLSARGRHGAVVQAGTALALVVQPGTELQTVRSHIGARDIQVVMCTVILLGLGKGPVPGPVAAALEGHADPAESFDLVITERGIAAAVIHVVEDDTGEPGAGSGAVRSDIGGRRRTAVFVIIGFAAGIVLVPAAVRDIPDHTEVMKEADFVLREPALFEGAAVLRDPPAELEAGVGDIIAADQQVAVLTDIGLGGAEALEPALFGRIPPEAQVIEPADAVGGQDALDPAAVDPALAAAPAAEREAVGGAVMGRDIHVAELFFEQDKTAVHLVPGGGQGLVQLGKEASAVGHLVDDGEVLDLELFAVASFAPEPDGLGNLIAERVDGIEVIDIGDDVENERLPRVGGGERAADLLFEDDRGDSGTEQNNAGDVVNVDALVEHVDGEEDLEVVTRVGLESGEGGTGLGVIGVGCIEMGGGVYAAEPLGTAPEHALHGLVIRDKEEVLAAFVRHVLFEDHIQTVGALDSAAERLEHFLGPGPNGFAARPADAGLITLQVPVKGKHGEDILRRSEDAGGNGLAQGHLGGDAVVEELVSHVTLVIQVADIGGGEAENGDGGTGTEKAPDPFAPLFGAAAVELVKNDGIRPEGSELAGRELHEPGIGHEGDIPGQPAVSRRTEILKLRLKNVFRGREPQHGPVRMILAVFEADKAFAGAGRVNDTGFAGFGQHGGSRIISRLIMRKQLDCHRQKPPSDTNKKTVPELQGTVRECVRFGKYTSCSTV